MKQDLARFGLVHRIDKNTTGLLVMAKTPKAMTDLAKQFFDHTVHRRYVALVWGDFEEDEGTVGGACGQAPKIQEIIYCLSRRRTWKRRDYPL